MTTASMAGSSYRFWPRWSKGSSGGQYTAGRRHADRGGRRFGFFGRRGYRHRGGQSLFCRAGLELAAGTAANPAAGPGPQPIREYTLNMTRANPGGGMALSGRNAGGRSGPRRIGLAAAPELNAPHELETHMGFARGRRGRFLFIVLVEHPLRQERLRQASRAVLPGLNGALSRTLKSTRGKPAIPARRVGGANRLWRLTQPISYPAQSEPVEALLEAGETGMEGPHHRPGTPRPARRPGTIRLHPAAVFPRLARHRSGPPPGDWRSFALGDEVFLYVVGSTAICLAGRSCCDLFPRTRTSGATPRC